MSKFTKIAVAATMAFALVGTSLTAAQAGKRKHHRNVGLGIAGAIIGAAIVGSQYDRGHSGYRQTRRARRNCWIEEREVWSNRRGYYVIKEVRVCS